MSRFFGGSSAGLVDALVANLPSPEAGAKAKIEQTYSGALEEDFVTGMYAAERARTPWTRPLGPEASPRAREK